MQLLSPFYLLNIPKSALPLGQQSWFLVLSLLLILVVRGVSGDVIDNYITTTASGSTDSKSHQKEENGPTNSNGYTWDELDQRPLPEWFDEAKFGIFIHWGVFSVPEYGIEWFQEYWQGWQWRDYVHFVNATERPNFAYAEYAGRFRAELYNPNAWSDIFARSGAQYVVLTSKHHEGYCIWNSTSIPTTWNWNSIDLGSRRDLLGELNTAVKNTTSPHTGKRLKFGIYHSLYEWFNPFYLQDKANQYQTQQFVNLKTLPELYDLVQRYEPELIWSDGEWESSSDYWKAREFLSWYGYNSTVAADAVWNDRWGNDTLCQHGAYLTCLDRYQPDSLLGKKWENSYTIDRTSYGFNRNATYADYYTTKELLFTLIQTVSKNGNLLLNIGPHADGTIDPIFVDRLLGMGDWLSVNGDAIYGSKPWNVCQNETRSNNNNNEDSDGSSTISSSGKDDADVYYTRKADTLFAFITKWPTGGILEMNCPIATSKTQITMLGYEGGGDGIAAAPARRTLKNTWIKYTHLRSGGLSGIRVELPDLTPDIIPCQHAWVLKLTGLGNLH